MNKMKSISHDAGILANALPFMQRYEGKTVVIKYGGHAMGDPTLGKSFAKDIALLKQSRVNPVVVHGGGPQIGTMLEKMGIVSTFEDGLRVTDRQTVEIVEMVLAGSINKQIVALINSEGERCVGLSGKDGGLVFARKAKKTRTDPGSSIERIIDLGFVGEPENVDCSVLEQMALAGIIPVVAPVAPGTDGETYNINADTFAGAIAQAMGAERLLMLTDVEGILGRDDLLLERLSVQQLKDLIAEGTVSGGMIPKAQTCIDAIENGVEGVVIVNGRVNHAVLIELFTDYGAGTLITP